MAGFDVTGVDCRPMPRYPFRFVLGDALEYVTAHRREYAAIAASPPCQAYSRATAWRGDRRAHPDLIGATRELLVGGPPYVIETVQDGRDRLQCPLMLCGSHFGLRIRRHRYFEVPSLPLILVPPCRHQTGDYSFDHGNKQAESVYRDAMGCGWMTVREARQAIPPAYTAHLGANLLAVLRCGAEVPA